MFLTPNLFLTVKNLESKISFNSLLESSEPVIIEEMKFQLVLTFATFHFALGTHASLPPKKSQDPVLQSMALDPKPIAPAVANTMTLKQRLEAKAKLNTLPANNLFDLPITYNHRVQKWMVFFTSNGRKWFQEWIERSTKYVPFIQKELKDYNLPMDLAYIAMIESGFDANAISHASAVGPWQFIQSTGQRYGLRTTYWLDERRDLKKSTQAAAKYLRDLYREFGSWYLVAASYNMGENGLRRQMQKYQTRDFWTLARVGALPQETVDYVPKILAAMMLAKAPGLYGFRDIAQLEVLNYDLIHAPGGTDLRDLADHLNVTRKGLRDLNAELVMGVIPKTVDSHMIRIPKGSVKVAAEFLHKGPRVPQPQIDQPLTSALQ